MNTLIGKRIVCKYISNEENNGIDALGDHEEKESKNRDGDDVVITDTIAIGFIENVYIDDFTDENGDRKSTRLNSSHANISYAVFCLKKKKKQYAGIFT